jgi:hypothetical protein
MLMHWVRLGLTTTDYSSSSREWERDSASAGRDYGSLWKECLWYTAIALQDLHFIAVFECNILL